MRHHEGTMPINIGWGEDITIRELAEAIARLVGFRGTLEFDTTRPDGTPRKLLDVSRLTALGWRPRVSLEAGLDSTYEWVRQHESLPDRVAERPVIRAVGT